jgi:hypothetical protein
MSAYPTPRYPSDEPARKLASDIPTTTARPLYTVPSGKRCTITLVNMTNIHSSSTTINIYHTRAGESPTTRNALYYDVTIAKNAVSQDLGPFYLGAGESLWALCSTGNHATITLYGIEE